MRILNILMRILLPILLIFVFLSSGIASAQQWTETYGGSSEDEVNSIQQTSNGGRYDALSSDISVSPTNIDFGTLKVGRTSTPSVITISNTGTGDLHISGMLLWDAVNYSLDVNGGTNPCGSTTPTLAPNDNCTVTVTFSPTSTGTIDGSLAISSDDPYAPTLNVLFTGMGTLPWCGCEFYPDTTTIPRGGTLGFWANVTNHTVGTWTFYYATRVTTPHGSWYPSSGYLLGPVKITLTYHESRFKDLSLFIPNTAPLGTYTYHGYIGLPGNIWDECTFTFIVTD